MRSFLILVSLGITLSITNVFSQKGIDPELRDKIKSEMINFHNNTICPQMMTWKTKIDNTITKEDLQKLNNLRDKAYLLTKERINNINQLHDCQSSECRKQCKREMRRHGKFGDSTSFNMRKDIGEELKSIISKYPDLVSNLREDAKSKNEEWQGARKAIFEKYAPDASQKNFKKMMNRPHNFRSKKDHFARIFLFNGECNSYEPEPIKHADQNLTHNVVTVFPNPFSETTTISFIIQNSSNAKLTIINSNGKIVAEKKYGLLNAGKYNYELTSKDLLPGLYNYTLDIGGTIYNGKVILNK